MEVQNNKHNDIQSTDQVTNVNQDSNVDLVVDSSADTMDTMLHSLYSKETTPEDMKIRLQNRLACQKAMESRGVSFWWLPATIMTVTSFAIAAILGVLYVVININGANTWMPNFLQFVSEIWLKVHLIALGIEVMISWLFTVVGVWKGNLVENAKLF